MPKRRAALHPGIKASPIARRTIIAAAAIPPAAQGGVAPAVWAFARFVSAGSGEVLPVPRLGEQRQPSIHRSGLD